ncbi:MAG: mechanosensitive ion channel [Flavipsychrobacter sp.]
MEWLDLYKVQIVESIAVVLLYLLVGALFTKAIEKVAVRLEYQRSRVKMFKKVLHFIVVVVCLLLLMLIWGVNQSRLLFFLSSFLTVLGVAFVAQWSILSNITATIILFFNHPVRIGDYISVAEKDAVVEGKVSDIGIFFISIKTKEGELITIPSNVFIQKAIKKSNS